jgi:mRNA-degrading endonuclease RelE of RelBE toxin-antitoxin system
MSYKVIAIPKFEKELKKLVKKYPSLKEEFIQLVSVLRLQPDSGTPLGNNCFKIRLSIASKGKGKSGGARVITYVQIKGKTVFMLTIYDKNEQDNISDKELYDLLKWID